MQKLLIGLIEQHTSDSKKKLSQILKSFFLYTTPKVLESFGDQTPTLLQHLRPKRFMPFKQFT